MAKFGAYIANIKRLSVLQIFGHSRNYSKFNSVLSYFIQQRSIMF